MGSSFGDNPCSSWFGGVAGPPNDLPGSGGDLGPDLGGDLVNDLEGDLGIDLEGDLGTDLDGDLGTDRVGDLGIDLVGELVCLSDGESPGLGISVNFS